MPLSSPPTAVAPLDDSTLSAGISASATTLTLSPFYKTINGVKTKQGINTTSGIALIRANGYEERVSFTGASVDATTKVTTVTGLTRGLSVTSTTADFSAGTGRAWNKGARFTVVVDASYLQSGVFTNVANTFTAVQTFSEAPVFSKGTHNSPFVNTGARDAYFTSPTNGDECYVTGVGKQVYSGGAWVTINASSTGFASDHTAGTVDPASATEIANNTAVDATSGAINVIPVSQTTKTSNGASDENKIPVLQADGALHINHIATGTPDGTKFVRDDGTLQTPDFIGYGSVFGDASDGNVTLSGNTTLTRDMYYNALDLSTFTLNTAGFKVYARSVTGSGKIKAATGSAGSSGSGITGGTGGAGAVGGTLPSSTSGSNGANGTSAGASGAPGNAGTNGTSKSNCIGSSNGASGGRGSDGSSSNGGNGGGGGTSTVASRYTYRIYEMFASNIGATLTAIAGTSGSGGGGGGGCTLSTAGGGGGGGGGEGGHLFCAIKAISGTWTLESIGGAGGSGANGSSGSGGGGGGAGGNGGCAILVYRTGSVPTFTSTGGAGGAVGSGGSGGVSGSAGSSGTLISIQIS